ncbi:MAG: ribonuclease HIII [Aquificaceae bacterium]|nr:ribonuclease HIII [Aquificaceae bacterium]
MSSLSIRVPREDFENLKFELLGLGFCEREVLGALWSLSDGNTHLVLYPSGTLLLQGKYKEDIKELIFSRLKVPQRVMVGCDESGKGDVFGPLLLCCAVIKPEYYRKVLELNPRDCKKMKDEEVVEKAKALRSFCELRCRCVEPLELNLMWEQVGNLNRVLDKLYGEILKELEESYPSADFFVDAYSARNPFGGRVVFKPKGEENLSVAVASVLARAGFLEWLDAQGLPKGSSPDSLSLARALYQKDPEGAKKLLKTFFL